MGKMRKILKESLLLHSVLISHYSMASEGELNLTKNPEELLVFTLPPPKKKQKKKTHCNWELKSYTIAKGKKDLVFLEERDFPKDAQNLPIKMGISIDVQSKWHLYIVLSVI